MVERGDAAAGSIDDGEVRQVVAREEGKHTTLGVDGKRREAQAAALLSLVPLLGATGVVRVLELELLRVLVGLGLAGCGVGLHVAGGCEAIGQGEASRKGEREIERKGGGGGGRGWWVLLRVHLKIPAK
jgi:hypothetical protein